MPPDDIEFDDLDTEDDAEENQAPADLVAGDTAFPDEEEIDVKVAEGEADEKEAKEDEDGEQEPEGRHKRPNRLQRERRKMRAERQRADAAEAEIQRLRAENTALSARAASAREPGADDDIDREITEKEKRFAEVRAQFDPDKAGEEARLLREITALEVDRRDRKKAQAAPVQQQAPVQAAAPHRNIQAWLDKNDWFDDPQYERETRRARAIDAQVHADGYRVEDDDYFEEVERRMQAAGVKIPGRSNGAGRKESIVAGRVDAPTGGKHSVVLTRDDLANIQKLGMNPRDKAVLEEYARNKRRDEQRTL